jgi:phosphatidylserine/phosphatidylglycerophosphate/cardiolipin synthase-like enzyme
MHAPRALLCALTLSLSGPFVLSSTSHADTRIVPSHSTTQAAPIQARPPKPKPYWEPPTGVLLNDVGRRGQGRVIISRVIRTIDNVHKGEYIRIVVWNLDDRGVVDALIRARDRGVLVQVVVSWIVGVNVAEGLNHAWPRLARQLNRNTKDLSFAVMCRSACRSDAGIMHSKIFLFSKVRKAETVSMFGSSNLTAAAGSTQWNDLVTVKNKPIYDFFLKTFEQYAADKAIPNPYTEWESGDFYVQLFPARNRNPVVDQLNLVKCAGATGGTGNENHHTVIRIAIAGWFDRYGDTIAQKIRQLWDSGCDIKIITTLAGGGINQILRKPTGRGAIPIREVTQDRDFDGIPEKYLHLKAVAISGVFDGNTASSVVLTGSPNWSSRAQRSDEVLVRMLNRPGIVAKYTAEVNRLFSSVFAHIRTTYNGPSDPARRVPMTARTSQEGKMQIPDWFEND